MQPLHPQASEAQSQLPQQVQPQQLAEKLQQKLQGDSTNNRAPATVPEDINTVPAADSQPHTDRHSDRRHHKGAHAHFADDADDHGVTGRNDSITAVRGGEASSSRTAGAFWRGVDINGSFTSDPGLLSCFV